MLRSQRNRDGIFNQVKAEITRLGEQFLGQPIPIHDQLGQTAVWMLVGSWIAPLEDRAPTSSRSWIFVPRGNKLLFFCHYFSCFR